MQAVIWGGAVVTLAGVAGLLWSVRLSMAVRAQGLQGEASTAALTRVMIWNMAALGVAAVGLMLVVAGIILR